MNWFLYDGDFRHERFKVYWFLHSRLHSQGIHLYDCIADRLWFLWLFKDNVLKTSLKFEFLWNLRCENTGKPEFFVQLIHHPLIKTHLFYYSVQKLWIIVFLSAAETFDQNLASLMSSRRYCSSVLIENSVLTPGQSRSNPANM